MKPKTMGGKIRRIKAWAIVSRGGILIGGGDKHWGYTPLCVYSTKVAAKDKISPTRPNDKVVQVVITYET